MVQPTATMEDSNYHLTLNYQGKDVPVIVNDLRTAMYLLNDNSAAEEILQQYDVNSMVGPIHLTGIAIENEDSVAGSNTVLTDKSMENRAEEIWCKRKPTEIDIEATKEMLQMRQELASQFDDKKNSKSKLWQRIGSKLQETFNLGDNGAEKCRQKFANLQRAYMSYIKHQKTTGTERNDDVPQFFDELHSILGSKDKVNPASLDDSMSVNESEETGKENIREQAEEQATKNQPLAEPSTSNNVHSDRFKRKLKNLQPTSKSEMILKEMKEDRQKQEQHFSFFKQHLERTENQRERFLKIIEKAFSRKRKHSDSSSSETD